MAKMTSLAYLAYYFIVYNCTKAICCHSELQNQKQSEGLDTTRFAANDCVQFNKGRTTGQFIWANCYLLVFRVDKIRKSKELL